MALSKNREVVTSHQQIINKADSELATISHQISAAQSEIEQATEELGTIAFRRNDLQTKVSQEHERLQKVQAACTQAQFFAENLAEGLPSEASAFAALETARQELQQREQALTSAQRNQAQEEVQLGQREQVLGALIAEKNNALATLSQRRVSFQTAREQAHEAMGQETYERIAAQLQALQEQVVTQNRSLIDRKLDLKAAKDAAISTLAPWRHLQEKVIAMDVFSDATTRLLNACLSFMDVLERESNSLSGQRFHVASGESYANIGENGYANVYELCGLRASDLQDVKSYGPAKLIERREMIKTAIAEHTRTKARAS